MFRQLFLIFAAEFNTALCLLTRWKHFTSLSRNKLRGKLNASLCVGARPRKWTPITKQNLFQNKSAITFIRYTSKNTTTRNNWQAANQSTADRRTEQTSLIRDDVTLKWNNLKGYVLFLYNLLYKYYVKKRESRDVS